MAVKEIPRSDIKGAVRLTSLEMNKVGFDTGHHTPVPSDADSPKSKK